MKRLYLWHIIIAILSLIAAILIFAYFSDKGYNLSEARGYARGILLALILIISAIYKIVRDITSNSESGKLKKTYHHIKKKKKK